MAKEKETIKAICQIDGTRNFLIEAEKEKFDFDRANEAFFKLFSQGEATKVVFLPAIEKDGFWVDPDTGEIFDLEDDFTLGF